jgi:hypothetical protein
MATGASSDTASPGVERHDWRGRPLPRRSPRKQSSSPVSWDCLRDLTPSIWRPVADVVFRRIVVSPVDFPESGTIKVHRDGRFFGRVTDPVDAIVSWQ